MKTQHKKSEYVLSKKEVRNIINSAKTFEHRCMIKCLYFGGMRVSEVDKLEVQHIDFSRNVIHIIEGKGNKSRTIPFLDSAFKADMRHLIGDRDKGKVFDVGKRMIQYIVQKTGEKAEIQHPDPTAKHINAHLFRHSIARHLKSDNFKPEFIQKFLGHSSIKTTMDTYGTLSLEEMQELVYQKTADQSLVPETSKNIPEVGYQK